ncbi:MAG: hypothetical protein ACREA2_04895 [Blastocatellia bacterium]
MLALTAEEMLTEIRKKILAPMGEEMLMEMRKKILALTGEEMLMEIRAAAVASMHRASAGETNRDVLCHYP